MTEATCKDCGEHLVERKEKSKRPGEILLVCQNGHKWQARNISGFLHLYRSNWKGQRGERRRIATITISPSQQKIMDLNKVKQQYVFNLGIDTLLSKQ